VHLPEATDIIQSAKNALESGQNLTLDEWKALRSRLYKAREVMDRTSYSLLNCDACLERVTAQIESAQGNVRHAQVIDVGEKTLNWARIAGITGIVAVALAVLALTVQIWLAKAAPSKPGATLPMSSPQMTATISESPEQAAISSSATPSPELEATIAPSATP
jgi:hypothetical protein